MTDRARVARHFLKPHYGVIDLFGGRTRIINDLFQSPATFRIPSSHLASSFVFYYLADLCHKN
jgi:hypothetical protein